MRVVYEKMVHLIENGIKSFKKTSGRMFCHFFVLIDLLSCLLLLFFKISITLIMLFI